MFRVESEKIGIIVSAVDFDAAAAAACKRQTWNSWESQNFSEFNDLKVSLIWYTKWIQDFINLKHVC